ncbi:MAG: hypothetical protein ACK4GL_11875 [Flavobacteriales bacterium]
MKISFKTSLINVSVLLIYNFASSQDIIETNHHRHRSGIHTQFGTSQYFNKTLFQSEYKNYNRAHDYQFNLGYSHISNINQRFSFVKMLALQFNSEKINIQYLNEPISDYYNQIRSRRYSVELNVYIKYSPLSSSRHSFWLGIKSMPISYTEINYLVKKHPIEMPLNKPLDDHLTRYYNSFRFIYYSGIYQFCFNKHHTLHLGIDYSLKRLDANHLRLFGGYIYWF